MNFTVAKYVRKLKEKGLIRTEPTMVRSKGGRPLNGNLLYTIRPIKAESVSTSGSSWKKKGSSVRQSDIDNKFILWQHNTFPETYLRIIEKDN